LDKLVSKAFLKVFKAKQLFSLILPTTTNNFSESIPIFAGMLNFPGSPSK
jgi:hypothetical protein